MVGKWGLSMLVEAEGVTVLLDAGPSASTTGNAHVMGIDLSAVDKIVLSHGHNDHTGGLKEVLAKTGPIEIVAHPDIWSAKYTVRDGRETYIGIPFSRAELEGLGASFTLSKEPVWISDDIVTTGEIPMVTDYEEIDSNLYVKEAGQLLSDPLLDDLALIVKTERGLVVILGCGHRGMINTLHRAREVTNTELINTVVGGTHLFRSSEERILLTAAALQEFGVQRLGVSHCTGFPAAAILARELGEILLFNTTGTQISIP